MDKISVVIPCYNEEEAIPLFYKEIDNVSKNLKEVEFEFIFVNDGSKDKTIDIIKQLHKKDRRVRYVSFSRNFFKEAAIYAGLKHAKGDYAVIIDADLQHPPHLIIDMYKAIKEEGYDSVACKRTNRKGEPLLRSLGAKIFYKLMNLISKTKFVDGATDYRMMKKKMYQSVLELGEYNRFSKGLFEWVGFKTKWIGFENVERKAGGKSRIPFFKSVSYAIEAIVSFSTAPLMLAVGIGLLFCIISFIIFVFNLVFWGVNNI